MRENIDKEDFFRYYDYCMDCYSNNKKPDVNLKNYKYFKINRDNEDKKAWSIKKFIKNDDKIIIFLRQRFKTHILKALIKL